MDKNVFHKLIGVEESYEAVENEFSVRFNQGEYYKPHIERVNI